ncbi:MAG: hypothetical protein P4L86_17900 [Mycobacterium sp.]|nr:hypothetical protein [Mycobacterium sp.]
MTITVPQPQAPIGAVTVDPWQDPDGYAGDPDPEFGSSPKLFRVVESAMVVVPGPVRPAVVRLSALQNADNSLEDPVIRISMRDDDIWLPLDQARGVAEAMRPAIELLAQWEDAHETYQVPPK